MSICNNEIVQVEFASFAELVSYFDAPPGSRRFVLLAGPQGSGKSYFAKRLRRKKGNDFSVFKRLSADKLLKRAPWLTESQVNALYGQKLEEALQRGLNIVDDNLNVKASVRAKTLTLARRYGYTDIAIVYFDLSLSECLARNDKRRRRAVDWIVSRVWEMFYQGGTPSCDEASVLRVERLPDTQTYRLTVSPYIAPVESQSRWVWSRIWRGMRF